MGQTLKRTLLAVITGFGLLLGYTVLHPDTSSAAGSNSASVDSATGVLSYTGGPYSGGGHAVVGLYSPVVGTVYMQTYIDNFTGSVGNFQPVIPGPGCQTVSQLPSTIGAPPVPVNVPQSNVLCTGVAGVAIDLSSSAPAGGGTGRTTLFAPLPGPSLTTVTPGPTNVRIAAAPSNSIILGGSGKTSTYLGPSSYYQTSYTPRNVDVHGGGGSDGVDLGPLVGPMITLDGTANDGVAGQGLNVEPDVNEIRGSSYPYMDSTIDATGASGPITIYGPTSRGNGSVRYSNNVVGSNFADTLSLIEGTLTGGPGDDNMIVGAEDFGYPATATARGGDGNDTILVLHNPGSAVQAFGDAGTNTITNRTIGN